MDGQDHRKTSPDSGHENQEVHLCHKCGWPFPNPHPSAKHRRAHKRICGTIEGYKLIDSGQPVNSAVSDDEHDDDPLTPSPKIEKTGHNEIGRVGFDGRSNRSEDEVFSDAVTEFVSVHEDRLECAMASDKNEEKVSKADATAGVVHLTITPTYNSQVQKPKSVDTASNLVQTATSSESIILGSNYDSVLSADNNTEELAVGLSRVHDSASDLPPTNLETLIHAPTEHAKADVGDLMQYSTRGAERESNIEEKEESSVEIALSDVAEAPSKIPINAGTYIDAPIEHAKTDGGSSMQYPTSGVEQETNIEENEESGVKVASSGVVVIPGRIASESSQVISKFEEMDRKILDSGSADQVGEWKEEEHHEFRHASSLHNLSPEVKSLQQIETSASSDEVEPDSAQAMDVISFVNLGEDLKDEEAVKGNLPATVESCEIIEPVMHNDRSTVHEEKYSSFHSSKLGANSEDCTFNATKAPEVKIWNGAQEIQTDSYILEQHPCDFGNGLSMVTLEDDKVSHTTNLNTSNDGDDLEDEPENSDRDATGSTEVTEEEPSTNIKATSKSADNLSALEGDVLGAGYNSGHEMAIIGTSDLSGNKDSDGALGVKPEMSSEMTLPSTCGLPEPKAAEDEGMDKVVNNLQENETATYVALDSSEVVGPDSNDKKVAAPTHSGSRNCQDEDSQEAIKEPNLSNKDEVLLGIFDASCNAVNLNHDGDAKVSQEIPESPSENLSSESESTVKNYTAVEGGQIRDDDPGIGGSNMAHLQEEGDENSTKPNEVNAVAVSVDSSSQTDGSRSNLDTISVPVVSTPSAATAVDAGSSLSTDSQEPAQSVTVNLQQPQASSARHSSSKSDVFEPPSFMTLIEAGGRVDQKSPSDMPMEQDAQKPKSDPLQAAWFPSLTNVVNESEGRKKNEEIITKVTNWSTGGKQHTHLQSLLGEAESPTMVKKDDNNTKTIESPARKKDEKATKNHENLSKTVSSLLGSEEPANPAAKSGAAGEWNSPARYPTDNKKEKRKVKGRPYWVPFVCCSSGP